MNKFLSYLKNDFVVASTYAAFLTVMYLLGNLMGVPFFGYGFSSIIGANIIFLCLLIIRLKEVPKQKLLMILGKCIKIAFFAILLFFVSNFILSIAINGSHTISINGPFMEMPRLMIGTSVYSLTTLFSTVIVIIIKLIIPERNK